MKHLVLTKYFKGWSFLSFLLVLLLVVSSISVTAHSVRRVQYADSKLGTDQGDCTNPDRPCRTFDYTRSQAGKGDKICLSNGTFRIDYKNSSVVNLKLFNSLIRVRGDCSSPGKLHNMDSDSIRPNIAGVPKKFAMRLAKMGLGWAPKVETSQEQIYQQGSTTPQIRVAQIGGQRYVDGKSGNDQGNCADTNKPCKTIKYARNQAGLGDTINVASGSYVVAPDEGQILLADDIRVQGGFSATTGFTDRGPLANPTYVIGLSHKDRAALKQRGFILLQDRKALKIRESIATAKLEAAPPDPSPGPIPCENGKAGEYPCENVDYLSRIALHQFSSKPGAANDIWGFVDLNDEKEYAIIGLENGTAVVDVSTPSNPKRVPAVDIRDPANPKSTGDVVPGALATWRDIKVYQFYNPKNGKERSYDAYAYVTTDGPEGGSGELQVIDLTDLPERVSLVTYKSNYKSAHNIYISNVDYATGEAVSKQLEPSLYILGSNLVPAGAALVDADKEWGAFRIYALKPDAAHPKEIVVPPVRTFYAHDATSLIVNGEQAEQCGKPDKGIVHDPCEVLVDFNEDSVDLWDVTDKTKPPIMLSTREYDNATYTHSGWWSADKKHIFIHDELDEYKNKQGGPKLNTTLRVMNIEKLREPGPVKKAWVGPTKDIDHNGFAKGNIYYMSNYLRGLTVLDVTEPENAKRIAYFDTYPEMDDNDFGGAWGVYPYLRSGTLLVSDIQRGLLVLRLQ